MRQLLDRLLLVFRVCERFPWIKRRLRLQPKEHHPPGAPTTCRRVDARTFAFAGVTRPRLKRAVHRSTDDTRNIGTSLRLAPTRRRLGDRTKEAQWSYSEKHELLQVALMQLSCNRRSPSPAEEHPSLRETSVKALRRVWAFQIALRLFVLGFLPPPGWGRGAWAC